MIRGHSRRITNLLLPLLMLLAPGYSVDAGSSPAPDAVNTPQVDLADGEEIYFTVCQPCHGDDGKGGAGGGAPLTSSLSVDIIVNVLRNGQNSMPEFGSIYTDREMRNVATFILDVLIKQ